MGSWRNAYGRLGALMLTAVMLAGCSSASATWPTVVASGGAQVDLPTPAAPASGAAQSDAPRATAAAATVDEITADYVYTSELITPIAHLYGSFIDDFVVVTIDNANSSPVKVTVQSEISGYTDKASDTVTVAANGTEEVRQNPRLTQAGYDSLNSQHPADLHVVVSYLESGQPRTILDQTSPTLITSRDDFPWSIKGFTPQENYDLVVAMITPTDPSVNALIRTAANYDPGKIMTSGYDSAMDDKGTVWQRLSDIWDAETHDYSLTYISTPITFAANQSQRIRLPGEVLDQSSGNCIELTLLYAAAAEYLGLHSALVIVPGHAYVAISLDSTDKSYYFVETTMIGAATFDDATTTGLSEWKKAQPNVAKGVADYAWVDVPAARKDGILPIPWR
ncbi:MAG: hypothetical protein ACXWNI_01390 [Candidatus Limnocylindrales bacterium]